MMNRIVIYGGSFNPPTVAHLRLMLAAVKAVDACCGIFAPTAHEYVLKKMKKQRCPQDTLGEELRLAMLESLCEEDGRLTVNRIQMDRAAFGRDFEMLEAIQNENPDAELYYLIGSDKLYILPRWHRIDELLERFPILLAKRRERRSGQDPGTEPVSYRALGPLHNLPGA